jgi:thioredoxin reductase (NADPH)
VYDLVVIGAGVTGYAAAMYAARLSMSCIVIGETEGGKITLTDDVANYPGFAQLTGKELAEKLKTHALGYPVDTESGKVEDLFRNKEGLFYVVTGNKTFLAKSVLIATGMKDRELEVPGHNEFRNKGISYCALCDGPLFKDKVVAVVGGSDSAAKEALLLGRQCKKVYMIYRGERIRPEPINGARVEKEPKIQIITGTNVTAIQGDQSVKSVKLDKPFDGSSTLSVQGVFISIGGIPVSDLTKKLGVALNQKGEIIIDRSSRTNVPGVFAAGDVADTEFKQAITGVAEGVHAAYQAYRYVNEHEFIFTCQQSE